MWKHAEKQSYLSGIYLSKIKVIEYWIHSTHIFSCAKTKRVCKWFVSRNIIYLHLLNQNIVTISHKPTKTEDWIHWLNSLWETVKKHRSQLQCSKENVKFLTEILSICRRANYICDNTELKAFKGQEYTDHI